ncbi:tRNA uracil 4-sulfurtransferase ThiI [Caproiciproducens sp. CPB-2]|uniref:tRNA uracil 4-sulfurtransferase ThiI n=1 Tax=Caproiciproducens sp. CPB-2 TaxID=3030017 RepID=UPI0023DBB102|nr:tRNA uracil 4-sulfurtransferase ThiI [Caproiciproducens sp. CPB-2]MDF1496099.1 tRNA 4-thiouridine(8) synthase ThiI [Caproiciproducens sp. CPB-2]
MEEIILIKLGEMVLKGLNRNVFEAALIRNIKRRLNPLGGFDVKAAQSAVYVTPREGADLDAAVARVSKIFGIAAFSRACVVKKEMSAILEASAQYLKPELLAAKSFKVETKRADKIFPLKSPEISAQVGEYLLERYPHLCVDVHDPDITVRVEVRDFGAYVHGQALKGAGGIPVGTGGNAAVLISGGIDSPVAAWTMAKRGLELTAVHFASPPYTSERAEQKVHRLLARVGEYSGRMNLFTVPFAKVQEEIMAKCPEDLFTLIMRRFMMRVGEKIARRESCSALITGESLGQVASQTLQAIVCTDQAAEMPVLRPLIGMDKLEIIEISRRINTFDISIEPFEDCCTVFTPKHPRTQPRLPELLEAERALDCENLTGECVRNAVLTKIYPNQ